MLDTCEGYTMFDLITAPNVLMLTSSGEDESAYSSEPDHQYNVAGMDTMTKLLMEYFASPIGYVQNPDFKIGDFPTQFPAHLAKSHIHTKSTGRSVDQVMLREYIPVENTLT